MNEKKVPEPKRADAKNTKNPAGRSSPKAASRGVPAKDVGRALRSVYDETLREDVPDDFLDLLGKLS